MGVQLKNTLDYNRAGNWSDMISGLATTVAVSLSLLGLWNERRRRMAEDRASSDREITQVYMWLTPRQTAESVTWYVSFRNLTEGPIYDWSIFLEDFNKRFVSQELGPIRPGDTELLIEVLRGVQPEKYPKATLRFKTSDGRAWMRSIHGKLSELPDMSDAQLPHPHQLGK